MNEHEPPRGALLITVGYLMLLAALWVAVFLQGLRQGMGGH
jgi:hypothetical protein